MSGDSIFNKACARPIATMPGLWGRDRNVSGIKYAVPRTQVEPSLANRERQRWLRLVDDEANRAANFHPHFVEELEERLRLAWTPEPRGDLDETFGPEDVFDYIYAILHSPTYRERYSEFLKIDFPRIPLTSDVELFRQLVPRGKELVALHLMQSPVLNDLRTTFPQDGDCEVAKGFPKYAEPRQDRGGHVPGRVYINKEQYFEGVAPEVWEFHVGGYQVCEKWLKDRRGRTLDYDDIQHYQKVIVALDETIRLMAEIDEVIDAHGGWPIK